MTLLSANISASYTCISPLQHMEISAGSICSLHTMQVLAASSLCELQFAQPLQANCTLAWHFSPKKALRTCVFLESKRNIRRNFPLRNAELANGRLALLSAQQRATRVKARAAKTEEEELFVCGG